MNEQVTEEIQHIIKDVISMNLFEPLDMITFNNIKTALDEKLAVLCNAGKIVDWVVICDDRNNTPQSIDKLQLKVETIVKYDDYSPYVTLPVTASTSVYEIKPEYNWEWIKKQF